jgi:hypothetical protein
MTRHPLTNLAIRRAVLLAEAKRLRDARDMAGAARAEAELRAVVTEILREPKNA